MNHMADNEIVIDPRLALPPVEGARYKTIEEDYTSKEVFEIEGQEHGGYEDDNSGEYIYPDSPQNTPPATIPIPVLVEVVSQTVRISPDGTHVVDIVLEVEIDEPGMSVEARSTKI